MSYIVHDGPPNGSLARLKAACGLFAQLRGEIEGADAEVFFLANEGRCVLRLQIMAGRVTNPQLISPLGDVLAIHGEQGQVIVESDAASISRFLTAQEPSARLTWNGRVNGHLPEMSVAAGTFESGLWLRAIESAQVTAEDLRSLLIWRG